MKKRMPFAKHLFLRRAPQMRRWWNSRRMILSLSSLFLFLPLIVFSLSRTGQRSATTIPVPVAMQLSLPLRLRIPLINVDAPIEAVGISTSGTMSSPAHDPWGDVGWYDAGPGLGQHGSSVIDGHLDRPGGSPAVFWRLRELHIGNEVDVMDNNRQTVRFRVVKIAYYPPQHAPLQE